MSIQACLDSTIMTYLQQQQRHQSPTTYPLQKQNRSQQLRPVPPKDTQKHKTIEKRLVNSDLTSTQRSVHLGTGARIAPGHSARDQTKLSTELQRCNKDLQRHERHRPAEIMRPLHRGGQSPRDVVVDNHEDDSEYGEETVKDDGDQDEDSEMDDSDCDDDYDNESDIDNDHTETEQSIHGSISLRQNDPLHIGLAPCQRVSQGPSLDASDGLDNTQKVQQELVEQMELAAKTWANGDIHGSTPQHSPGTNSANSINYSNNHKTLYGLLSDEEAHLRLERTMSPGDTSNHGYRNGTMGNTAYNMATVNQSSRANASSQYPQHQNGGLLLCSSSNGSSPVMDSREARMRTVPYVDDEDEENDEEDGEDEDDDEDGEDDEEDEEDDEDEMSDEYDEEEEEEEEYSYSEEEDEDEEDGSMTEYHYGSKDDVRVRGHYPRSGYPHYRLPRLDGNFLQKRAINKQVERRSSLTALLGEASQPEMQPRNIALQAVGVPFGQHIRQHNVVTRRPALSCVWTENDGAVQDTNRPPRVESRMDNNNSNRTSNTGSAGVPPAQPHVSVIPSIDALIQTQESQEPNRPRRTDSGVVVKLSPQLHRMPAISHSNIDGNQSTTEETVSPCDAPAASTSSSPSATPVLTHRSMIKSEGDVLGEGAINHTPRGADAPRRPETVGAACGSKTLNNLKQPLRSSISCNTFPRVAGKRDGRKHVSWHHSLFPTERVLRVKPSLPSLSTVAAESAKATLSQLPSIPVMAKDNVKDFHQSIKSLRTVSRIEITKMSYKQQGRQELTSPVPIARSVHDSIPWWNPSRWLKGSVTVDKRHWKVLVL
ncbi:hypothetical protein BGZ50_005650 [Haplosporangium sp. Z 11]|nr:hypothetical protein BGZ50_005650 [Haplosporangium sp. Z 11]